MKPNLQDMRTSLEADGPRGPGRRYSRELRVQITAWVDSQRRVGRDWRSIAGDLGVARCTLKRWCSEGPTLAPVVVRPSGSSEAVTLVAPTGWRIEGLSLAQVLDVLGERSC